MKKNEPNVVTSGFAAMYGVENFWAALLSDTRSPRTMSTMGMLLTEMINILIGFTGNVWPLTFLWGMNGLAQGCGSGRLIQNYSEWFSPYEVCNHVRNLWIEILKGWKSNSLFLYLNTVTSTENYTLVTTNITESNKKKLSLIITCNNRLATVVEFLAKKSFL